MGLVLHKLTCTRSLGLIIYTILGQSKSILTSSLFIIAFATIYTQSDAVLNSLAWQLYKNLHSISITSDRSPHQLQLQGKDSFSRDITPQSHSTLVSDGPSDQKGSCHQWRKGTQLLISQDFLFFSFLFST